MSGEPPLSERPEDRAEEPLPEALARLRKGGAGASLGGAGRYAGLGLQFGAAILLFVYIGQWLDRRWGTDPLFLYIGAFTGAGAAFYSMYRSVMADQRREESRKRDETRDRTRDEAPR